MFGHDHAGHGESEGERVLVADMAELTGPLVQHCRDKMEQVGGHTSSKGSDISVAVRRRSVKCRFK